MRSLWREILLSILMGMIIPGIVLNFGIQLGKEKQETVTVFMAVETNPLPQKDSLEICVRMADGTIHKMDMDRYITGVVLGEMPATFHEEALKAQGIVARTYALKAAVTGGKHGDGSVCTEPSCCQAYVAEEEYLSGGGDKESLERIRRAVVATSGYVLMYEGSLIEATYFSCSGGYTEDAVAVWGTDFPYLRATESPGEETAEHYTDSVTYSEKEFLARLGLSEEENVKDILGEITHTAGGGVDRLRIGGEEYLGTELRKLLGLRSTNFTLQIDDASVTITTKGYGHRVGMSQYGADAMGEDGADYRQILSHYYYGTELILWEN